MRMALKILVVLYGVGIGWCLVAALRAYQRTGWASWRDWVRSLGMELLLLVAAETILMSNFAGSLWLALALIGMAAVPRLLVLVRVFSGDLPLEGFAGFRDWLRLAMPDERLAFDPPPGLPANAADQLWVPQAKPRARLGIFQIFRILVMLIMLAGSIIMLIVLQ